MEGTARVVSYIGYAVRRRSGLFEEGNKGVSVAHEGSIRAWWWRGELMRQDGKSDGTKCSSGGGGGGGDGW